MTEKTKGGAGKTAETEIKRGIDTRQRMINLLLENFPIVGLALVLIFFGIVTKGQLFTPYNIKTMYSQMFLYLLGGLGCLYLFAQGGIDLSMASNIGCAAIIGVQVMKVNIVLGILVTFLVAMAIGLVMGLLYAYSGIPVFILGLAMNFLLAGLLWPLCFGQSSIATPLVLTALKSNTSEMIIAAVCIMITLVIYNHTRFGKECRAMGAGITSAVQSGVNIQRNKILAFVITGFTCGLVAVLTLIRTGAGSQTTGASFNFNVMISLVLGGCVMSGGDGVKVRNAIVGAIILIVLQNGLSVWGANIRVQDIVKGVMFVVMIVVTTKLNARVRK